MIYKECRYCRRRQRVEMITDGAGGLVERPLSCRCDERRRAGLCLDCPSPVEGKRGLALRCAPCKKAAQRMYCRRWRERHPKRVRDVQRRSDARRREQKAEYMRTRWREKSQDPEWRARRNERRRELAAKNPGRKAEHARRYKERHPERVQEQQRRANKKRAGAKREYMHRWATKYVGEGKTPKCRACGGDVEWGGVGRPRLDCEECRP